MALFKKNRISLVLISVILGIALFLTIASGIGSRPKRNGEHLVRELPTKADGWAIVDSPIASTPEMQKAVKEMLNYDDAVFRTYSRVGVSFSLYAAYWSPGRFHPRLISIHTPDVCWMSNGLTMPVADTNRELVISGRKLGTFKDQLEERFDITSSRKH